MLVSGKTITAKGIDRALYEGVDAAIKTGLSMFDVRTYISAAVSLAKLVKDEIKTMPSLFTLEREALDVVTGLRPLSTTFPRVNRFLVNFGYALINVKGGWMDGELWRTDPDAALSNLFRSCGVALPTSAAIAFGGVGAAVFGFEEDTAAMIQSAARTVGRFGDKMFPPVAMTTTGDFMPISAVAAAEAEGAIPVLSGGFDASTAGALAAVGAQGMQMAAVRGGAGEGIDADELFKNGEGEMDPETAAEILENNPSISGMLRKTTKGVDEEEAHEIIRYAQKLFLEDERFPEEGVLARDQLRLFNDELGAIVERVKVEDALLQVDRSVRSWRDFKAVLDGNRSRLSADAVNYFERGCRVAESGKVSNIAPGQFAGQVESLANAGPEFQEKFMLYLERQTRITSAHGELSKAYEAIPGVVDDTRPYILERLRELNPTEGTIDDIQAQLAAEYPVKPSPYDLPDYDVTRGLAQLGNLNPFSPTFVQRFEELAGIVATAIRRRSFRVVAPPN